MTPRLFGCTGHRLGGYVPVNSSHGHLVTSEHNTKLYVWAMLNYAGEAGEAGMQWLYTASLAAGIFQDTPMIRPHQQESCAIAKITARCALF